MPAKKPQSYKMEDKSHKTGEGEAFKNVYFNQKLHF